MGFISVIAQDAVIMLGVAIVVIMISQAFKPLKR